MDPDKIVLGIDLGTTYSCAAYVDETDRVTVLQNAEGEQTTPSVVYFETADNTVVGKIAKANAVLYKDLVVSLIKREMGSEYSRRIWDVDYKPEMISSFILRKLVRDSEQYLGLEPGSLKNVVVTCPAYFGFNERSATKNAGRLADLNVLRVMNEPTAAAFCYGITRSHEPMTALVYDLGGGTFDITLISVKENDVEVIMTAGKRKLGGKDWDDKIVNYLAEQFIQEYGEDDGHPLDDPETAQRLALDAEDAKKSLTALSKVKVTVSHAGKHHTVEISREKFNELTVMPLLQETVDLTRRLLERAEKEKGVTKIDKLLLVGGSTRMPQVAMRLQEELKLQGEMFDPDQSVAKGAAMIGKLILDGVILPDDEAVDSTGKEKKFLSPGEEVPDDKRITIVEVASKSFGVQVLNYKKPEIDHLVHNQDRLPIERVATYYTEVANQPRVHLSVFEQAGEVESKVVEHNKLLVDGFLALPSGLPEAEPIEVTFRLSGDGQLNVIGRHKTETIELKAKVDGVMSKSEVEAALTRLRKVDVS